jgi:uncharacterized protein YbaR (Trm112 family)
MPITFRCPACRNKLSTAKRKAGSLVTCPGCNGEVRVPTANEKLDPQVERLLATAAAAAETPKPQVSPFDFREGAQPPSPPPPPEPKPTVKRVKPLTPSSKELNDLPLFERPDFAEMLEEAAEEEKEPLPLPTEPARQTKPADGFVVTRGTAIAVLVAVMALLGLAFTAGFLVGRMG